MKYLLDTHIVIALSKGRPEARARLAQLPAQALLLSPVVLCELEFGIAKSQRPEVNRAALSLLVAHLPVPDLNAEVAVHYGRIRAALEAMGQPIGPNDLLIAAQALTLGAVLVTDNVREFSRVPGLLVENWLA
ncbi:type II toxin-antitoxin system VapC family toxin [Dechloromonas sp. ZY10]|uniref:type II toxin-antitoxin system VapC family toxin n=1 Tax=Dechloromonas aquae TaxID=2664436 RepID=UPI003529BF61